MIKKLLLLSFLVATIQGAIAQQSKQSIRKNVLTSSIIAIDSNEDFVDQMSIYPNPASSKIVVSNNSGDKVEVTIFNIIGDPLKVKQSGIQDIVFDISNLSDGVYIVAFNNGDEIVTQRLVKNN